MTPGLFVIGWVVTIGILVILAIIVIALIGYFVGIYNNLVTLKNDIDRSFANIDVMLKQRHDELPKLIDTCKGYMQYEQKTLLAVTEARTAYMKATTPAEKTQADNMMTGALKTLFAVAEKYPDLKANTNFMQLQGRITDLETKIAGQRSTYNEDVNAFNIRIGQIPANFVAGFMHLQPHALFQVAEADREDVKVSFT
ncbi:MAG: LemA family protein [Acidobacteriia bacterium]|nr:LemA family protein [Terriglobia bacterium]